MNKCWPSGTVPRLRRSSEQYGGHPGSPQPAEVYAGRHLVSWVYAAPVSPLTSKPSLRLYFCDSFQGSTLVPEGALVGKASLDGAGALLSSQTLVPEAGQGTDLLSEKERVLKPLGLRVHTWAFAWSPHLRGSWGTFLPAATHWMPPVHVLRPRGRGPGLPWLPSF